MTEVINLHDCEISVRETITGKYFATCSFSGNTDVWRGSLSVASGILASKAEALNDLIAKLEIISVRLTGAVEASKVTARNLSAASSSSPSSDAGPSGE